MAVRLCRAASRALAVAVAVAVADLAVRGTGTVTGGDALWLTVM
jgi:hypothetical protein